MTAIILLLVLILLCMFKTMRIFVGIMILLMCWSWAAHSEDLPPPDPQVVAAVLKKFPAMQRMTPEQRDIGVGSDEVVFYTPDWHMWCRLMRNPLQLRNCRIVHG